jgi:hypothetical protein
MGRWREEDASVGWTLAQDREPERASLALAFLLRSSVEDASVGPKPACWSHSGSVSTLAPGAYFGCLLRQRYKSD